MSQPRLHAVPCTTEKAKEFVLAIHRHHGPNVAAKFALACADETDTVRGVALVGRPVARLLDDGMTLEVNRVATDGCPNACSFLYGLSAHIGKKLGYRRIFTYIREDEPGISLRGAGWVSEGPIRARSWNMPGRARVDKTEVVRRERWTLDLTDTAPPTWPELPQENPNERLFA